MRRLFGYSLFCIALGMLLTLLIEGTACLLAIVGALLLGGYYLFCCS